MAHNSASMGMVFAYILVVTHMIQKRFIGLVAVAIVVTGTLPATMFAVQTQETRTLRQEEEGDHYAKWLKEDAIYIITPQEKGVFNSLQTPEEKEQFIEQFWFRRDPDPTTSVNEFREEHYRRIAYANENFASGWQGWRTDRGRVYIIHGPPVEIESHPAGARYDRPMYEGGGTTSTYAYETWRYRYIEGMGSDVVVEFVDASFSGEYKLALTAQEKDALLIVAEQGKTLLDTDNEMLTGLTPHEETLFGRYETYTNIVRPTELKHKDLERFITVDVDFQNLPLEVRTDYFRLNEDSVLIPITVEVDNSALTFVDREGNRVAGIVLYGLVTSLSNRVVGEFEHDLLTSLSPEQYRKGLFGTSFYQKILHLDSPGRYKMDLIVQDLNSDSVGVVQQLLVPPSARDEKLSLSSLVLSDSARQLEEIPDGEQMFVLGDVWILPSIDNVFTTDSKLTVYFQLYGASLDQASLSPSVEVNYQIRRPDGKAVIEVKDASGESLYSFSSQRLIFMKQYLMNQLSPGEYSFVATIQDLIGHGTATTQTSFEVVNQ